MEMRGSDLGSMQCAYGGDALNTAIYFARLAENQYEAHFVTAMGRDTISQSMMTSWREEGVVTESIILDPQRVPGIYLVQIDAQGERHFSYWRNESAARYLWDDENVKKVQNFLADKDVIYFTGVSIAILPDSGKKRFINEMQHFRSLGKTIIFDSNYRKLLWKDTESAKRWMEKSFRLSDIALVSDQDEFELWNDTSIDEIKARIHALGVKGVVVRQGAKGARYSCLDSEQNSVIQSVDALSIDNCVDTTAAGDAFSAGFLFEFLNGESFDRSCDTANQVASRVIQYPGAIIPRDVDLLNE